MPFERTSAAPERLFLYGAPGSGKSSFYFSLARKFSATNTPARIHLIDADNAYYDMIDEVPEADGIILPTFIDQGEEGQEWNELDDAIRRVLKDADPERGDWIVVDRVEPSWEWVQDAFVRSSKQKTIDEVREEGRKPGADKNLRAGMQGFEWGEVKSKFRKPFSRLVTSGCNIIITAGESKISEYTDASGQAKEAFGGLPFRPAGGAGTLMLAHMFRDIIHLRCTSVKKGLYFASTAKGRGRKKKLDNAPVKDAAFSILIRNFGWKVTGNGGDDE